MKVKKQAPAAVTAPEVPCVQPSWSRGEMLTLGLFAAWCLVVITVIIGRVTTISMLLCLAVTLIFAKSSLAHLRSHMSIPVVCC